MGIVGNLDTNREFEACYARYRLPVYRMIRGIVLNSAAAEDLTQETFERALKWRQRRGDVDSIGAFLRRIALNAAISHLRRQKLTRLLPSRLFLGAGPSPFDRVEARMVVTRALATLSPKLRVVVVLHFYWGLTRDEIAKTLGIPPGTVASRSTTAIDHMRRTLADTAHVRWTLADTDR
jgi:RNA polymerase sigma factor (sigma-70 family)